MQPREETRYSSVLLLGPTGSGKTPLGQLMQERGLWGLRCLHFDFGHELRQSVSDSQVLSDAERELVSRVLRTGALLEDEHFPVALKIFETFLASHNTAKRTLIILNGLPRHTGQAERLQEVVRMMAVVNLECKPETVLQRISNNAGGDRTGRIDDSLEEVKRKLELFRQRTAPLLIYYKAQNVGIISVDVGPASTAADALEKIEYCRKAVDRGSPRP
jgi:adenylate kinase family enzyme